jgi:lysophospholipase L1-like esterase
VTSLPPFNVAPVDLAACSGETAGDIARYSNTSTTEIPQLDRLTLGTRLVTMTAGGDDLHFADVLQTCLFSSVLCAALDGQVTSGINRLAPVLLRLYTQIRHQAPNARIVVIGYPNPFPVTVNGLCDHFSIGSQHYLSSWFHQLNSTIFLATVKSGVQYLDMSQVFGGHSLCSSDPWENVIELYGSLFAPIHPNVEGYVEEAKLLAAYVSPRGQARRDSLRDRDQVTQ